MRTLNLSCLRVLTPNTITLVEWEAEIFQKEMGYGGKREDLLPCRLSTLEPFLGSLLSVTITAFLGYLFTEKLFFTLHSLFPTEIEIPLSVYLSEFHPVNVF